ncbi:MAG: DUF1840 domain-containing protein [Pseudomonadota bacterium]|nr:DUF1840 domain-containing protein [Pseudomonadota bacterium]
MIQFSSPAAAKIAMLQTHARRLLDIIGKPDAERGALAPEEIPAAVSALRAAIESERRKPEIEQDENNAENGEDDEDQPIPVDLARRAWPLIDMLERSQRKNVAVTWGV